MALGNGVSVHVPCTRITALTLADCARRRSGSSYFTALERRSKEVKRITVIPANRQYDKRAYIVASVSLFTMSARISCRK
jgi:hypothetical protein